MDVAKALESHLECPICLVVPRDGVMLTCLNGHDVCSACKDKIGADAKCPQCRGDFNAPPAANSTAAGLIERFFRWPCRYQSETGCEVEGAGASLATHEATCGQHLIDCPQWGCTDKISFGTVVEHLVENTHKKIGNVNVPRADQVYTWFTSGDLSSSKDFSWSASTGDLGQAGNRVLCSYYHERKLYVWLWQGQDFNWEPEKCACNITLAYTNDYWKADTNYYWVFLLVPVYPITLDRTRFLREENRVEYRGTFFANHPIEVQGETEQRWNKHFSKSVKRATTYKCRDE